MEEIAQRQHRQLSADAHLRLAASLRRFVSVTGGVLAFGTGCSGTDVISHAIHSCLSLWTHQYGITIEPQHVVSAEAVDWKRRFIAAHWDVKCILADVAEMAAASGRDAISGECVGLLRGALYAFGFECDSISSLNRDTAANRGCVARRQGKTGETCHKVMSFIKAIRPPLFILENVKNLNAPNGSGKTDQQELVAQLNLLGYMVSAVLLRAEEYGIPQHRHRIYLIGVLSELAPVHQEPQNTPIALRDFAQMLGNMRIPCLPLARFLLPKGSDGLLAWEIDDNAKRSKKGGKTKETKPTKQPEYEVDHLQHFERAGLPWPPSLSDDLQHACQHLSRRESEIVFLDEACMAGKTVETLRDLTMSIDWGRLQENQSPCLVSTSRIWLRLRRRSLAPSEALALQGFSHRIQKPTSVTPAQAMDLAGNAFCGAVVMPILSAVFACLDWERALRLHDEHHASEQPPPMAPAESSNPCRSVREIFAESESQSDISRSGGESADEEDECDEDDDHLEGA